MKRLPLALMLLVACVANAQVATPEHLRFRDAAEEARFHQLTSELRCVMCQNQSIADSHAQIAQDLRREVLEQMQAGQSDAQIKQYLVQRYGEFVLYKPRIEPRTWLLWFGPLLFVLAGAALLAWLLKKRGSAVVADDNEQEW